MRPDAYELSFRVALAQLPQERRLATITHERAETTVTLSDGYTTGFGWAGYGKPDRDEALMIALQRRARAQKGSDK